MIAACLLVAVLDLAGVVALAGEGRLAEALEAARAIDGPLERGQAEVYVLFEGRDYAAALEAARSALERAPAPGSSAAREGAPGWTWLAERAAAAALFFEAPDAAESWVGELRRRAADLEESRREVWLETARRYEGQIAELRARSAERERAVRRARRVALAGSGLLLAALVLLARPPG